jgi:hypothetical protein
MGQANFTDDVVGAVCYNADLDRFEGTWKYKSSVLDFSLNLDGDGSCKHALMRARQVLPSLATYVSGAKGYAVDELLDLKNENWLDDDEKPLTPDEFKARMTLKSIGFDHEGDVTFYHNDGDLFWGHLIEIGMNVLDEFNHADIPG